MRNRHVHATVTSLSIVLLVLLALGAMPHRLAGSAALAATEAGISGGAASSSAQGARLAAGVVWESEAEDGTFVTPMVVGDDTEASGGKYAYCPREWSSGTVTFTVDVTTTADYYLWVRVKGWNWTRNSFFIRMDDGDPLHYEIPQFSGEWAWGWDMVRPVDQAPVVLSLEEGEHTLTFQAREANAGLDRLLLTDDPTYLPDGASTPLYVWREEAEDGALDGAMVKGVDTKASDCEYIYSTIGFSESTATYTFDVVIPGDYYLWVRAMGESYTNNSFFVSVDGESELHYEVPQVEGEWRWAWDAVHVPGQEVQPFALAAGEHTVRFRAREKNTRLDVVVVTNDTSYVPGSVVPCPMTATPTSTDVPGTTPTATNTPDPTPTDTPTATAEPTSTATDVPTDTPTPTETVEPSATPTEEATATPTLTPTEFVQPEGVLWLPIVLR